MKRNKFSLSHHKLLSCNMGSLIPINLTEVLPGDTIQQASSVLLRVSPLMAPVMHPVHVRIHHWFVPMRLLWDDWETFITGGDDGMDVSEFPTLTLTSEESKTGSLADYLGVPIGCSLPVSALPFRAYNLIFNEWYRDQDLVQPVDISTASGLDEITELNLLNAAWERDYFTSARPWPQKGPGVTIPIGGNAPVTGAATANIPTRNSTMSFSGVNSAGNHYIGATSLSLGSSSRSNLDLFDTNSSGDNGKLTITNPAFSTPVTLSGMSADLTHATGLDIRQFRESLALQRYQEARARYGSRYSEYLRYYGIRSSDARLQEPEYLGGGKQTIQFSEVLQTAEGESPVGEMRGHGIAAMRSNRYRKFFEEHGYIVSLLSIRPKTIYTQGLSRTWSRRIKEDFFQRELQHIGQQEIMNKELYAAASEPDGTFGFQDRYDEYRRSESGVAGEFRDLLDYWHYARVFATEPALNSDFITAVPTKRVNAVQTNDVLYCMINNSIQARRMLSKTGTSMTF